MALIRFICIFTVFMAHANLGEGAQLTTTTRNTGLTTPKSTAVTTPAVHEDPQRCTSVNTEEVKTWSKSKGQNVYFITRNKTEVVAQAGSKAILPCSVRSLCDGTVSWIRRNDYNLLTVGAATYANDERFQTVHSFGFNQTENSIVATTSSTSIPDWSLQIKFVQLRDAGYYECQVTSHPPFSIIILLKVVEARVEIDGGSEKFVKVGSSVELTCTLLNSPSVPEFVFWYHNDRMVNYDVGHGMNITTDLLHKKSFLEIRKATRAHTGNYTCVASNAYPDSTMVHVLNGILHPPILLHSPFVAALLSVIFFMLMKWNV